MANPSDVFPDPFADLESGLGGRKPLDDVANANPGMNVFAKPAVTKTVQLKAENFELYNQNERLVEENGTLGTGLNKLQNKHDKLMYLARNRLSEVRTKYQKLEQDNQSLREQLERLRRAEEQAKKLADEHQQNEDRFKANEREMRTIIEKLKRDNDDLKTKYSVGELHQLRENFQATRLELEQAKREAYAMRDAMHKANFERDTLEREVGFLNEKINELSAAKKKVDLKVEELTEKCEKLQTHLKRSEGNCQLLHERLTAVKKERDTIETESRAKIGTLSQNLKELQHSSKTLMDQFRVQSKQCEHLDRENKQLTEYVNGYRKENDILAKQLVTLNQKQQQMLMEIESYKSADASVKNEEALRMQNALTSLTDQLTQLRKLHANTLAENRQTKELLIEKESVLTSLGYERHQLQDKVVKNEHALRQMERRLAGRDVPPRPSPVATAQVATPPLLLQPSNPTSTLITNSFSSIIVPT